MYAAQFSSVSLRMIGLMLINPDKLGEALQGVTSPKSPALEPLDECHEN